MRKVRGGIFEVRRKDVHVEHERLKEMVQLGNTVFVMPDFLHEFGINDSVNPLHHEYEGSFLRHLAVEQVLVKIRDWLIDHDALPGYAIIQAFLSIFFGLNCNFSPRNIGMYFVWYLRGCKPCSVMKG